MSLLPTSLRFALRSLGREPGYALAFILTLGLGIGANTAIFSLVNGVLLRPLPYPRADDIVRLEQPARARGLDNVNFSFTEIADYREQSQTVEEFVEFGDWTFNVLDRGEPHRANGGLVTANFFEVMGMRSLHGRLLEPADRAPGAAPVAVLTHGYWQRCCGGDPAVIGQPLNLTAKVATIVGVLAPGSHYATQRGQDFYVNYAANDHYVGASMQEDRRHRMTTVFARIEEEASIEQARAELEQIAARLAAEYPDGYPETWGMGIELTPWQDELTAQARPTLLILLGTAGFVLVIACANVANLSLTRLTRRESELAVRSALGASGGRLRRLLLVETLVLALPGAALGLLLATSGLDLLVAYASRFTTRTGEVAVDGPVLAFTLAVALGAAVAFTLVPPGLGGNAAGSLVTGGGHATAGRRRRRMQRMLVVGQVGLSFMLLVGSGLLLRSLANLYAVDPGYDLESVLSLEAPKFGPTTRAEGDEFNRQLIADLGAHPGVRSAAVASGTPLGSPNRFQVFVKADDDNEADASESPVPTLYQEVTEGYFEALGVPVLRGRTFASADNVDAPRVVIVSESFARRHYDTVDVVGRQVAIGFSPGRFPDPATIVGVVGDTRSTSLAETDAAYYVPASQGFGPPDTVFVRTAGDPGAVTPEVVESIRALDPERPVEHVRTLAEVRSENIAPQRLNATLFAIFAALALTIAAVGIAGVLAYSVSQRTREFGIRLALGAKAREVLGQVLREGGTMVLLGLALGTAGAIGLSRVLADLLFEVEPIDPITLVGMALVLLLVALAAAFVPARRATAVHPMEALRSE